MALDSTTYEQLQGSFASLRMTGLEVSSHVQSSGLSSPHPLFFPLPRPAGEGKRGEGPRSGPTALAVGQILLPLAGLHSQNIGPDCSFIPPAGCLFMTFCPI